MNDQRIENGQHWRLRGSSEVFELAGVKVNVADDFLTLRSLVARRTMRVTVAELLRYYERVED
jgi:hypothetical protein